MRILRDYQLEASRCVDATLHTHGSTLVVMATGLGKTIVMSDLAKRYSSEGYVLLLAHRVELLDQAAARFEPDLGYKPAIIQAARDVNMDGMFGAEKVIVGSVQTLVREKRLGKLKGLPFRLVLVDEAHHCTAKSYRKIVDSIRDSCPDCKLVGVTATPTRSDKKALGLVFESVAYQMESAPAIDLGWLVEPIEERVVIEGVDFEKIELKKNEDGEIDFDRTTLESLMTEEKPLQAVAVPLLEKSRNRKSLVFTAGVRHAHIIADILNRERPDSAVAIDGESTPPGHPAREDAIRNFANGSLQYLVNYGVFVEGFDSPSCSMVTIARPTKSLTVLIQMLGRGLRPLSGIVDGKLLAIDRKVAIANSSKPTALILYFIPKSANIRTVTTYDALGGNFDDDTRELAKTMSAKHPDLKVLELLRKAEPVARLIAEEKARKKLKARVDYTSHRIGDYAPDAMADDHDNIRRGGASERQIEALINMGVSYETAAKYSGPQAGAVLGKLRQERCTNKQRALLEKYGYDPQVNFDAAREIIDALAANNWKPLPASA